MTDVPAHHQVASPLQWPPPPEEMTYSTFQDLRSCPRRWALMNARYPAALWEKPGYPLRPGLAALSGVVQHAVIEKVVGGLGRAGVTDLRSSEAVAVLRQLGGFSALLTGALERELEKWQDNPRASPVLDVLRAKMRDHLPVMRGRVQMHLARMPALPAPPQIQRGPALPSGQAPAAGRSGAGLRPGVYAEKWLTDPRMDWKGKVDLLHVEPHGATIVDFKTGDPKPEHALQLHIYGLLWRYDETANPSGIRAVRLILSYPEQTQEVPVQSEEQQQNLRQELETQTKEIRQSLTEGDPPARPSARQCSHCEVRHLCPAYWRPETQQSLREEAGDANLPNDAEVRLARRYNGRDWEIQVVSSLRHPEVTQAVLRLNHSPGDWLRPGARLRLLSATSPTPREGEAQQSDLNHLFTLTAWGEVYHNGTPE